MKNLVKELNQIQAVADLQRELSKTVAVLRALKAGEINLDNLTIDGDAWKVAEVAESVPVPVSAPIINSPAREAAKAAEAAVVEKTEPEPVATE